MYRRPNDLLAAYRSLCARPDQRNHQRQRSEQRAHRLYVLHKGADAFMSQEQFEKFYWPTWKQVMLALV
jgi:hypothetical protein